MSIEHYAYEALCLFFKKTCPGSKCRANGELLKTYSVLSEIFSPILTQSLLLGWGNQQSDLTSVDWRTNKELWREKPQPIGYWVELAAASALPRSARGPLSLRVESLCVHTYRTPTQMPGSKTETSLSSSSLRKLLKASSCLLNVWLLEISLILGPCLRWINANCSVCSSESDSRSFYNCNKLFFFSNGKHFPCR